MDKFNLSEFEKYNSVKIYTRYYPEPIILEGKMTEYYDKKGLLIITTEKSKISIRNDDILAIVCCC